MVDADSLGRLREHQGCVVLVRYLDFQADGMYSLFNLGRIGGIEVGDVPGIQMATGSWIPFGENMDPEREMVLATAIVDVRNHKGEALYRNGRLEGLWKGPRRDSEENWIGLANSTVLHAYGIEI